MSTSLKKLLDKTRRSKADPAAASSSKPSDGTQAIPLPPPRPPMSASPPRLIIIGAGSRGRTYGRATISSSNGLVVAVAEPIASKRETFGRNYIWGADPPQEGQSFESWSDFLAYELRRRERAAAGEAGVPAGVDGAFVCVQDEQHREVVVGLAPLGLHIMCEKPLAGTLADCLAMYRALRPPAGSAPSSVFAIGHVLRYSPHNTLLRKLVLEDRAIGDVCSVEHTEPVGWWHFTHSYVRGNWRREDTSAPSLLAKSCHDVDLLLWFLCSPPRAGDGAPPHLPATVSSTGALQYFRRSRKPAAAGDATNCLSCPLVDDGCKYSAKNIYLGPDIVGLETGNRNWPISIVVPEIEDYKAPDEARAALTKVLAEDYTAATPDAEVAARNWFGRCVYECDNDVNDDQTVTMTWDAGDGPAQQPKTATLHMVAHSKKVCQRYTYLYGTDGEIFADSNSITVEDFNTGATRRYNPEIEDVGHGGGDIGLTRQFVLAVDRVKNHGWDVQKAQDEFLGCSLDDVLRSHAMVFAAEAARKEKRVLDWEAWWQAEVEGALK